MKPAIIAILLSITFSGWLCASTITEWNFNDSSLNPGIGSGSISLTGGMTDDGYNTGYPAAPSIGWSTTNFPAQGTNNLTAGIYFELSTEGYHSINLSWVVRHSNTSPNRAFLLYTLDRTASPVVWNQAMESTATTGDAWFPRTFDGTAITGLNNNPNLAFKIVAAFGNTEKTLYMPSKTTSSYASSGKWRWDDIIISGTPLIPSLEITESLMPFYAAPGSLSPIQEYQVLGQNLVGHLVITAPAYFRLRLVGDEDFVTQLDLVPRSGGIDKSIQVLFQPTIAGIFTDNITHVGGGVSQQNIAVTGSTTLPEPNAYPTGLYASGTNYYQTYLHWTDSTGTVIPDGYLIIGSKVDEASIVAPVDGVPQEDKKLTKNVLYGVQTQMIYELNESHTYYFKIYPYTNTGSVIDYKTDGDVPLLTVTTTAGPIGSTLQAGDLAFVEYATDSPDRFSFVLLRDVLENTIVNFTDKAWTGTAFSENEETYEWRTVGRPYLAGEVIHIEENILHEDEGIINPNLEGLSNSGDQVIAYQGYITTPSFITAISTTGWITEGVPTNSTSYLPYPLVSGQNALGFSTEIDNGVYSGTPNGFADDLLLAINDPANWTRANSLGSITFPEWQFNIQTTLSQPAAAIAMPETASMRISWPEVQGAHYYTLFSSSDPQAVFPDYWQEVSTSINALYYDVTLSPTASKLFYRVTATH